MSVEDGAEGSIALVGACGLDDAEPLLGRLLADRHAVVDLRRCERLHTAVLQVLLASRASVRGPARGRFLRDRVEPLLRSR